MQGGTLLQVQKLDGWSSYEMVLRYAHLSALPLADYAETLCRPEARNHIFSGTVGTEAIRET